MKVFEIFTDGASKGNPGPAGIGVLIKANGKTVCEVSEAIGQATNNVAEYTALIRGLKEAKELAPSLSRSVLTASSCSISSRANTR